MKYIAVFCSAKDLPEKYTKPLDETVFFADTPEEAIACINEKLTNLDNSV